MIPFTTIVDRLREQGIRLTIQRRLVIEVLCEQNDHLTVQDVQVYVRQRGADLNETTVYRILQWLKEMGIVSQTDLGRSGTVYQLIDAVPHHHLVCLHCGTIIEVDDSAMTPLREHLCQAYGFEPRIDHMAIFGLCHGCQDEKPGPTANS